MNYEEKRESIQRLILANTTTKQTKQLKDLMDDIMVVVRDERFWYDSNREIAIIWDIEDVKSIDNTMPDHMALEVLQQFDSNMDGSMDSMWADLNWHVADYNERNRIPKT